MFRILVIYIHLDNQYALALKSVIRYLQIKRLCSIKTINFFDLKIFKDVKTFGILLGVKVVFFKFAYCYKTIHRFLSTYKKSN